ncbi:MAG: hypothetical protein ACLQBA_24985 [Candidatus Binataceae bacterium]
MPTKTKSEDLLKAGWWVALTLKPDTAPLRCYVGKIQTVQPEGLRLTLVDWFSGMAVNWDLFVPLENIQSALVCTDEHSKEAFEKAAGEWQEAMCRAKPEAKPPPS